MEIIFENTFVRDREWARDTYRYVYFLRPIMLIANLIFIAYFILGLVYRLWLVVMLTVLFGVLSCVRYVRAVKLTLKRDIELAGEPVAMTSSVTDEGIKTVISCGSEYNLQYGNIRRAVETKRYIYLWSRTHMLYSFKKDCFTVGDGDSFIAFIRNKGIRVRRQLLI